MKRWHSVTWICMAILILGCLVKSLPAAPPPVLTLHIAQAVAQPPVLDGKLDDPCWKALPHNTTFYKYWVSDAQSTPLRTDFQLGYDEKGVYLGIRLEEKEMSKLKATITQRDAPDLWNDDCVEIYFDSVGTGIGYRKFVVNALGTQFDSYRMDAANIDDTWSPDGWRVATSKDGGAWFIETFFPWDNLGKTAGEGDLWRFCMTRYSWSSGNLAASSVGGSYNSPDRFGWLLFLKGSGGDTRTLSGELARRVPGDWLLPLYDQVVEKMAGKVRTTTVPAILTEMRGKVADQLAECRKLAAAVPETVKACDKLAEDLKAVPVNVLDPVAFQQSVGMLEKIDQQAVDLKYNHLLQELFAGMGP